MRNNYIIQAIPLLLIVLISLGNCQIDPVVQESIDDLIENFFIPEGHVSALGLAIVKDGQVLYSRGYGNRDIENSIPADGDTLFYIGSISKSFTATIVIKVLSEKFPELGSGVLDTPISQLIPSYNLTLTDRYRSEYTTFRDLLAHRVGELPENAGVLNGATTEINELLYRQRYSEEVFPFRGEWLYSNGHFALAADIVAEISGTPYLQLLEDLLSEIGMTNTTYVKSSDDHDNMPNRAIGYYWRDNKLNKFNSELYKRYIPLIPAGAILSSPNDMAKYLLFHLNLGLVGGNQIVPEDVMKWLQKNSNPNTPYYWKSQTGEKVYIDIGYALALAIGVYDGWQLLNHGGYIAPYNSQLSFSPPLNLGIFSISSGPGALVQDARHDLLHLDIFDLLQGEQPLRRNRNQPISHRDVSEYKVMSSIISAHEPLSRKSQTTFQDLEIIGHYGNGLSGELDIVEKLNATGQPQLYLEYGVWGQGWLQQTADDSYALLLETNIVHDTYASGTMSEPDITITYSSSGASITFAELGPGGSTSTRIYLKDQVLGDLPVQPWSPDSCGPEN